MVLLVGKRFKKLIKQRMKIMKERMTVAEYRKKAVKKSKYRNKKSIVDGYAFDSKMEARYYQQLKWLKMAGEIKSFKLQPEYILQSGYKKGERKVRPVKYIADFLVTHIDGTEEIIDVKGKATAAFLLKKKIFEYKYPDLTLKVLTEKNGAWREI
jgi:hypothetical protein